MTRIIRTLQLTACACLAVAGPALAHPDTDTEDFVQSAFLKAPEMAWTARWRQNECQGKVTVPTATS